MGGLVTALFAMSFGEVSPLTAVVYGLVGLAGLYKAVTFGRLPASARHGAAVEAR